MTESGTVVNSPNLDPASPLKPLSDSPKLAERYYYTGNKLPLAWGSSEPDLEPNATYHGHHDRMEITDRGSFVRLFGRPQRDGQTYTTYLLSGRCTPKSTST